MRRARRGCLARLFRLALFAAIVWVVIVLAGGSMPLFFPKGDTEKLSANTNLPDDYVNILLLGADADNDDGAGRTDTMIVLSVNTKSGAVKLTSIMRDSYVSIPGHGENRINTAYRFGGAELAMKTVNENFGLNVTHYALVDFNSFPYLVEAVGGIRLTITDAELPALNRLVLSMKHRFKDTKLDLSELPAAGENVSLTGLQALAYARIRKIDSDSARTSRQRRVIDAILSKVRGSYNPFRLISLAKIGLQYTETNMSAFQLAALGIKVVTGGAKVEQARIPFDGAFEYETVDGMSVIALDMAKNKSLLCEFIYGAANP